jgi:hypothetical protein
VTAPPSPPPPQIVRRSRSTSSLNTMDKDAHVCLSVCQSVCLTGWLPVSLSVLLARIQSPLPLYVRVFVHDGEICALNSPCLNL